MEIDLFQIKTLESLKEYKRVGKEVILYHPFLQESDAEKFAVIYGKDGEKEIVAKVYSNTANKIIKDPAFQDFFGCIGGKRVLKSKKSEKSYFCSEYSNAGTLQDFLKTGKTLPDPILAVFIKQIAAILKDLHALSLYHGDITPSNILVNVSAPGKYSFKLCGSGHFIPKFSSPLKSPYADPRIYSEKGKSLNGSVDIWSLGNISYQLSTGFLPEIGGDLEAKGELEHFESPVPLSPWLSHLLSRMLTPRAKERITAEDIPFHPFFIPEKTSPSPYIIDEKLLGKGKFASVYLCRDKRLPGSLYAVKILNPIEMLDAKQQILTLGEITILMKVKKCPYCIKLYDFFKIEGKIYLVLEYCNGGDVESYFLNENNLSLQIIDEIRIVSYNLAKALEMLHKSHLIHRDIKAKNMLLIKDSATGRLIDAKLADFGTSRETFSPNSTFCGSVGCFAPEMFNQDYYDEEVDIWTYGIMLFFLAFLASPVEIDRKHNIYATQIIKYPEKKFPLPREFYDLIEHCLEFDPKKRLKIDDVLAHPYFTKIRIFSLPAQSSIYTLQEEILSTSQYKLQKAIHSENKKNIFKTEVFIIVNQQHKILQIEQKLQIQQVLF